MSSFDRCVDLDDRPGDCEDTVVPDGHDQAQVPDVHVGVDNLENH